MIKIYFNPSVQAYEVYINGVKAENILSVKPETGSDFITMPKATIIAMVEIVNEKPDKQAQEIIDKHRKSLSDAMIKASTIG